MKIRILLACLMGTWLLTSCQTSPPRVVANPKLQESAEGCIKNFRIIGIASAFYADDHDGRLPTNWLIMKDCLQTYFSESPRVLVCPSQSPAPTNWDSFNTNMVSYQMIAPGWVRSNAESDVVVYIYCPEHHFCLMGDGSVRTNWPGSSFIWPSRAAAPNTALEPTPTAP
jgi:hypothetical protein